MVPFRGEQSPTPVVAASLCQDHRGPGLPDCLHQMEPQGEKPGEADGVCITPQLLKSRSGEFALESILLLKLRGLGLVDLGCLGSAWGSSGWTCPATRSPN